MSRGLVNAIFASEARHPFWEEVFALLVAKAADGARASTHVEVVKSTGPGATPRPPLAQIATRLR